MSMLKRHLDDSVSSHFSKYKQILILLGARQVGKTTLLKRLFPDSQYLFLDNEPVRATLERYDINVYKQIVKPGVKVLILDEIHLLTDPGRAAKIIYDQLSGINLIITGSSSLNIKNKTSESLAGRKIDYHLYPLTFSEYIYQKGIETNLNFNIMVNVTQEKTIEDKTYLFDMEGTLENVLNFGLYPALINNPKDRKYLFNLVDSIIFKDILELNLVENKNTALNLLKLLAFQIGNLVNYSEIGNRLNIDKRTVKKYIEIFEQSFILFRLYPFSQNKRDEIGKTAKIYFYDLGLRNSLIDNFSPLSIRNDSGALFENFVIAEVVKSNNYGEFGYHLNYWRTKQGAEVDLVLSKSDKLIGIELKYQGGKITKAFSHRYPKAKTLIIHAHNFYLIISPTLI